MANVIGSRESAPTARRAEWAGDGSRTRGTNTPGGSRSSGELCERCHQALAVLDCKGFHVCLECSIQAGLRACHGSVSPCSILEGLPWRTHQRDEGATAIVSDMGQVKLTVRRGAR